MLKLNFYFWSKKWSAPQTKYLAIGIKVALKFQLRKHWPIFITILLVLEFRLFSNFYCQMFTFSIFSLRVNEYYWGSYMASKQPHILVILWIVILKKSSSTQTRSFILHEYILGCPPSIFMDCHINVCRGSLHLQTFSFI